MLGQRVNNYEVVKLLGEGGMGAVYEAEHRLIRRRVAIKVLKPELALDRELVQRFFNEARATSAIHHPNIIEIVDVGVLPEGVPYLVMELLEGENLCDRIDRLGTLEVATAVEFVRQAASALEAAHQSGIVHRDLKPENLFIGRDARRGATEFVKVLDFGIAKLRDDLTAVPVHTLAGAVLGTPPYMSPEQCRGRDNELDQRTDIYSLGIILYEAVCGAPPFVSDAIGELLMMHMSEAPLPPTQRRLGLSRALEAVILRALAKQPTARYQSMAEFGSALAALPASELSADTESWAKTLPSGEHARARSDGPSAQPERDPTLQAGEARAPQQLANAQSASPPRGSRRTRARVARRLPRDPLRAPEYKSPSGAGRAEPQAMRTAQELTGEARSSQPGRGAEDPRSSLPARGRVRVSRAWPGAARSSQPARERESSSHPTPSGMRRSERFAITGTPLFGRKRSGSHVWLWAVAVPMIALAVGDRPSPRARLTTQLHAASMLSAPAQHGLAAGGEPADEATPHARAPAGRDRLQPAAADPADLAARPAHADRLDPRAASETDRSPGVQSVNAHSAHAADSNRTPDATAASAQPTTRVARDRLAPSAAVGSALPGAAQLAPTASRVGPQLTAAHGAEPAGRATASAQLPTARPQNASAPSATASAQLPTARPQNASAPSAATSAGPAHGANATLAALPRGAPAEPDGTRASERVTGARFGAEVMPEPGRGDPSRSAPPAPAPPPPAAGKARTEGVEPGYLSLDTAPWSEVFLGDAALGTTPLIRVPLPPGRHLLTLRNTELSTSTTYAVDIKSGQTVSRLIGWGR